VGHVTLTLASRKVRTDLHFGCHCHPGSQTEIIWHRSVIESPFSVAAARLEPHRDSVVKYQHIFERLEGLPHQERLNAAYFVGLETQQVADKVVAFLRDTVRRCCW